MNFVHKFVLPLLMLVSSAATLEAQWVTCANVPGNDSIYTSPAGVGLQNLAVNGSRLFVTRISDIDSVCYTDDLGVTWQVSKLPGVVISGTTHYPVVTGVWAYNGTIFASGEQGTSGNTLFLWRSSDNGLTWTASSQGIADGSNHARPICLYADGTTFYVGTGPSGAFLSTDSGVHWVKARSGIATYTFFSITSYVSVNGLAAIGNDLFAGLGGDISAHGYGVVHTTLGDTAWTSVSTGLPANPVVNAIVAVGSTLYADVISYTASISGVYKSTDLGASWSIASAGLASLSVSAPNGAQYLFASGNNLFVYTSAGVYEMRGGDTSWTLMNGTGLPSTYSSNAFSLVGTKMFMTGLDNSVPLHSTTHVWKRDIGEITGVHEIPARIPDRFSLQQNYPNPFNPTTHFQFSIAGEQLVGLKVFDVLGREVATVVNEVKQPGRYEVEWNASGIPSGMYFYRLQAGKLSDVRKLLLMK